MFRRKKNKARNSRRWFQFSLRSVLLLTVVVAAVVAIFRPEPPGSWTTTDDWKVLEQTVTIKLPGAANEYAERHGRFVVRDASRQKRIDGRYAHGEATGLWTIYHANGRKAMEGEVDQDVPIGKWTAWHSNRMKAAELSFQEPEERTTHDGLRQLKESIAISRRDGAAAFTDSQGNTVARGGFADDRRTGSWLVAAAGRPARSQTYVGGLRHDSREGYFLGHSIAWNELIIKIAADLVSNDSLRQATAASMLRHCGSEGAELIAKHLADANTACQLDLIETIDHLQSDAVATRPILEQLAASKETNVAAAALVALVNIDANPATHIERLLEMAFHDSSHRSAIILRMGQLPPAAVANLSTQLERSESDQQRIAFQVVVAMLYESLDAPNANRTRRVAPLVALLERTEQHPDTSLSEAATAVLKLLDEGRLQPDSAAANVRGFQCGCGFGGF